MRSQIPFLMLAGALALTPATVLGQDTPPKEEPEAKAPATEAPKKSLEPTLVDGKYTNPYWGIAYAAKGLEKDFAFGGPSQLFAGKCADKITVEILVQEGHKVVPAKEWMALQVAAWEKGGRNITDKETPEGGTPRVLFVEESLSGLKRHHGYAFFARGLHGFQVHAQAREKSATSGKAILGKLASLEVGEDAHAASLIGQMIAKRAGLEVDDPMVLLRAGVSYLDQQVLNPTNPAMCVRVLEHARDTVKEGAYNADQAWNVSEYLGLGYLTMRQTDPAIDAFKRSRELAKKATNQAAVGGQSTYNLACAYSVSGKPDEAFALLTELRKRANWAVTYRDLSKTDPDFEAIREDPRWAELHKTP